MKPGTARTLRNRYIPRDSSAAMTIAAGMAQSAVERTTAEPESCASPPMALSMM